MMEVSVDPCLPCRGIVQYQRTRAMAYSSMKPSLWPAKRHNIVSTKATSDSTSGSITKNLDIMVAVSSVYLERCDGVVRVVVPGIFQLGSHETL